ncbi:wd repeat protein [Stylonychia lemnae]|uniref:Wd repeat protein n=1 Tax=Stylonychia lemnae TaxID=5949 RepID=A0A078AIV2_STYLE|nr:wd repeat protein [Stylonychia lemnae]|eukprot:CDW81377.1 wd repeat protein [Stylonychia lemnae]
MINLQQQVFMLDEFHSYLGCGDGTIKIYNAFTSKLMYQMGSNHNHGDGMPITSIRWRPNSSSESGAKSSNVIVSITSDGLIQHWAVNSSKCLHSFKDEPDNNLYALDFAPDGKMFATAGQDTRVYVYDEQTRQRLLDMKIGGKNLPGHSSRVFSVKFNPQEPNMIISGGWDRTIQIYDIREGRTVGSIYGPQISGDALDIYDDMIIAGCNRNKDIVQMFSLSKKQLIYNIDWESSSRKDIESGYLYGAKFSRPHPNYIVAGGAGKNEVKVFENNADGSASFRILSSIHELEAPCLAIDTSKAGDNFAFSCQDGRIYICNYKLEEGYDFEGYQGGHFKEVSHQKKRNMSDVNDEEEERKEQ